MATKHFGGAPAQLIIGKPYPVKLGTILPSGLLLLTFKEINEREHERHLRDFCGSSLAKTPFTLEELEPELMILYREPKSGMFFRAQIIDRPDKDTVLLFSIDSGHIVKRSAVTMNTYYNIHADYLSLPFESFMCHLDGLEFFSNSAVLGMTLDSLRAELSSDITATLARVPSDCLPIVKLDVTDGRMELHDAILDRAYSMCPGSLKASKDDKEPKNKMCTVAFYEDSGELFIQLVGESFIRNLESKIDQIVAADFFRVHKPYKIQDLGKDVVYVAPLDGALYRAKFLAVAPRSDAGEEMVTVEFIDYGNKDEVLLHQVRRANLIDPHMDNIPPLCHKVYLKHVDKIINYDEFGTQTANREFAVKVSGKKRNGCPIVTLYTDAEPANFNKELVRKEICSCGKTSKW